MCYNFQVEEIVQIRINMYVNLLFIYIYNISLKNKKWYILLKNKSNEDDSENNNLKLSSNLNYENNLNSGPEQDPEDEDFIKKNNK